MKDRFRIILSFVAVAMSLQASSQQIDVQSDTWVCCDGLKRVVASSDDGVERESVDADCQVGIFYYVWHGQHGDELQDITRLLEANPDKPEWGWIGQFHWSSKPALGYYKAGDAYVVARHMQMLMDAGVDFYFFDVTNAFTYDDQVQVVMNEIDRRTKLGLKTPKLAFCTHSSSAVTTYNLYLKWYTNPANDKYWLYWDGKPLVLINSDEDYIFRKHLTEINAALEDKFTLRYCWAWQQGENCWPWLAFYPQQMNYVTDKSGQKVEEQMTVSAAMHAYSKIGKSYHNGKQPTIDKYGLCKETPYGYFFQEQFNQALDKHPKVLMITQWNEWMAQSFIVGSGQESYTRPGAKEKLGEMYFVDVYNQEFSRDVEPCADPLIRDNYYLQMVSNLRKYKGVNAIPVPTVYKTIDIKGDLSQWDEVTPVYLDEPGDVLYTSKNGQKSECLTRKSNDIVKAQVTKDGENMYFVAFTNSAVVIPSTSASIAKERWMTLLLNTDMDYQSGWEGYDYMVSREKGKCYLYNYDEGADTWNKLQEVTFGKTAKSVSYQICRQDVGLAEDVDFDFKWVDNVPTACTDILDFISNGEAAPNGRFNYRYKGSQLITPTGVVSPYVQQGTMGPIYNLNGQISAPRKGMVSVQKGKKTLAR